MLAKRKLAPRTIRTKPLCIRVVFASKKLKIPLGELRCECEEWIEFLTPGSPKGNGLSIPHFPSHLFVIR